MSDPDLSLLPQMVLDEGEPVFQEPWEAQAFGLAISLFEAGKFTWPEWATALSAEIHGGVQRDYYSHWLTALEKLVAQKQLASQGDLKQRQKAWEDAAARTPHGQPIVLKDQ